MSAVILARDLQVGSIIDKVMGNPNIRGTVSAVNRFGNPVADVMAHRSPTMPANYRGATILAQTPVESRTLRIKMPPPAKEARGIAAAVDECYVDGDMRSVVIQIANQRITLAPDTKVMVWVPYTVAAEMFNQ